MNKNLKYILSFVALVLLNACSSNVTKIEKTYKPVFPGEPDKPRIQFLTSLSSSSNIEEKQSTFEEIFIGEQKTLPILKPFNLCVYENKIYICDLKVNAIDVFDLKNKKFQYFSPAGFGALKNPMGISVDKSGMYICDAIRNEVLHYDTSGNFIKNFGNEISGRFIAINTDENNIYVCDIKNRKIQVFDKFTTGIKYSFPDYKTADSAAFLYQPTHLKVKGDKIYVTDVGSNKIKIYTLDGRYLRSVGNIGSSYGQFTRPKGIEVDNDNNLYAIDAAFENVQIFNNDGKILMAFGGPYTGSGFMYLPFGIALDYQNVDYFKDYINPNYKIKYLIYVTNQFGPEKVSIYGFIDYD